MVDNLHIFQMLTVLGAELYIPGYPSANQAMYVLILANFDHDIHIEDNIFQKIWKQNNEGKLF